MTAYMVIADVRDALAKIPDNSVDMVMTSPPFLALRSYLAADDPAKALEIGGEATPGEFIDTLLDITEQLHRVLTPWGSLCVELGDTYAGSGGSGGDYAEGGMREGQAKWAGTARSAREADARMPWKGERDGWPADKSACLIPEMYRLSLAYGRNPLTGRETPRWRVRNTVRWCRPNPPVGALGDKFRPATSDLVIACKADAAGRQRFFDLDAVRSPLSEPGRTFAAKEDHNPSHGEPLDRPFQQNEAGAPPLDWWEIPTSPYKGSHYATYPPALCERPIKAMCPQRVCTICGEPSRRITETEHEATRNTNGPQSSDRKHTDGGSAGYEVRAERRSTTVGWTDCECPGGDSRWRPGRVLDPFGGSGTTAAVATGMGRDCILIDLDHRNLTLAANRVGMFLTEATLDELPDLLGPVHNTTGAA